MSVEIEIRRMGDYHSGFKDYVLVIVDLDGVRRCYRKALER